VAEEECFHESQLYRCHSTSTSNVTVPLLHDCALYVSRELYQPLSTVTSTLLNMHLSQSAQISWHFWQRASCLGGKVILQL